MRMQRMGGSILTAALLAIGLQGTSLNAASIVTNWTAFNDHNSGTGTAPKVTTYSLGNASNVGVPAGGALTNSVTGEKLTAGISITSAGRIDGNAGTSFAPAAGTPAALAFGSKIDWVGSALYFGGSSQGAVSEVRLTFTNLTPGLHYNFKGTAIRGGGYATRWTSATIAGASSYTPAHLAGPSSPGIITNGWSPYGDTLAANSQVAWNSGKNDVSGDLIVWKDIVPIGNSFSIICSNWTVATPSGGGNTTYGYAINAVILEEVGQVGPITITEEPAATTTVEEFSPWSIRLGTDGLGGSYQWYFGQIGSGTPILGANFQTLSYAAASLSQSGSYYVIDSNEVNSVTSSVAQVTVYVNPIVITREPVASTNVTQLRKLTLSVAATGTRPQYQWYKQVGSDVTLLANETSNSFTIVSLAVTDTGDYFCVLTNSLYAATSTVAHVVVFDDVTPPAVLRAIGHADRRGFTIEYNEPLFPLSAVDVMVYGSANLVILDNGIITNNDTTVIFKTELQAEDTVYSIDISGVYDVVGNPLYGTFSFRSMVNNKAPVVDFEVFDTGTGSTAVSNLVNNTNFPMNPHLTFNLTNFNTMSVWPDVGPDNTTPDRTGYGGRLRSVFIPPFTGKWTFFIRSDDSSELWFNPNGVSADGRVLIARETNCCNAFQEPPAAQTSAAFDLVAGVGYYMEAIYEENGGGDFCQVTARHELDTRPAASLIPLFGGEIGDPGIPAGLLGTVSVVQQPADVTVESPAHFRVETLGTNSLNAPFVYQWQQDDGTGVFTNIPNAHLRYFSSASATAVVDKYRCVIAAGDSEVTSRVAIVTVTPDVTGPTLLSVFRATNGTSITLTFSEPVLDITATNIANYQVCDVFSGSSCLTILSATMLNSTQVVVVTSAPVLGGAYRLTIANVTDLFANLIRGSGSAMVGMVATFQQGVNGYTNTVDTYVSQANPTNSYGTAVTVIAGNLNPRAHGLLRFQNLFGLGVGEVPLGSEILSATLRLRTDNNSANNIGLYRVLVPWSSTNTWNNVGSPNDGVNTNAGDAGSTAEFYFATGAAADFRDLDVTASVRFWATNGGVNRGWAFINTGDDDYQFNSSEATDSTMRPKLTISYQPSVVTNVVAFVSQPAVSNIINEGQSITLSVTVSGTLPHLQWYKDGAVIPGANGENFAITGAVETNSGRYVCVATNLAPSVAQTDGSYLVVNPDTNGPTVVSALATTDPTVVTVQFSRALIPGSATNLANYAVSLATGGGALAITGAVLSSNQTTVTLTTAARTPFAYYQLTVGNVHDTTFRGNALNPNPTTYLLPSRVSLLAANASWRYDESGTDLGTAWVTPGFNDSAWSSGSALFVAKRGTPGVGDIPILTTLSMTGAGGLTNITYYFRTTFAMPTVPAGIPYQLEVRPIVDDGAVFHINGKEAYRLGMDPAAVVTYSTFATRTRGNDYTFEGPYAVPTTNVQFGANNEMAVEVHQASIGSSDVAFAAEVFVAVPAPVMQLTHASAAPGTFSLTWPAIPSFQLFEADVVTGPYTLVPGNPLGAYSVSTSAAPKKFYMLRR